MTATILLFPAARQKRRPIIFADRRIMPDTPWKRARWVTILVHPSGDIEWWGPAKDRKTANWVAELLSKRFGAELVDLGGAE